MTDLLKELRVEVIANLIICFQAMSFVCQHYYTFKLKTFDVNLNK